MYSRFEYAALLIGFVIACSSSSTNPNEPASGGSGGTTATGGSTQAGGTGGTSGGTGGGAGGAVACGAGTCVTPPPTGWEGPFVVWTGTAVGTLGDCAVQGFSHEKTLYSPGTQWAAVACTKCNCDASGIAVTCAAKVQSGSNGTCNGSFFTEIKTTCTNTSLVSGFSYGKISDYAITADAQCKASGGDLTVTPPTSGSALVACSVSETCTAGNVCAPQPAGDFQEVCILRAGSYDCPAGSEYANKSDFRELNDGRTCAPCACGTPTRTCTGDVIIYNDTGCLAPIAQILTSTDCNPNSGKAMKLDAKLGPVSCPVSGGTAEGAVTETAQYTVCCK